MESTSEHLITTKKISVWLFLICLLLQAGYNDSKVDPATHSKVPAPLVKKWLMGEFPMNTFWEYKGSYSGKALRLGMAFNFKLDGQCEFYQVTTKNTNGSRMEDLVYKKGTVEFHPNQSFTFYPTQGNKREFVKMCDSAYQNYDQKASTQDLAPQTYYYTFQPDGFGQNKLIIRGDLLVSNEATLAAANW